MEQMAIEEIIYRARMLKKEGGRWHFHMLGRACRFNKNRGKFSVIFEDENGTSYCLFDEMPAKESKMLAELAYGKGFLEKEGAGVHNPDFEVILERAKYLKSHGVEWHHHHFPPECIFNEDKAKHCIVLEDPILKKVFVAVYDGIHMHDLTKIEALFHNL